MLSRVEVAEKELNQVMTLLREKQRKLAEVEAVISNLEVKYNASLKEKQVLEDDIALTSARLIRAGRLNIALGDEQTRWEQIIEVTKKNYIFNGIKSFENAFRLLNSNLKT